MSNQITVTLALALLATPEVFGQTSRTRRMRPATPQQAGRTEAVPSTSPIDVQAQIKPGMLSADSIGRKPESRLPQPPPPGVRTITQSGIQVEILADCRRLDQLPERGRRQIILAPVDNQMYLRVFNRDGQKVLDCFEDQLSVKPIYAFDLPPGMTEEQHNRGIRFGQLKRFFQDVTVAGDQLAPWNVMDMARLAEFLFGDLAQQRRQELAIPPEEAWDRLELLASAFRSHLGTIQLRARTLYLVLESGNREFELLKENRTEPLDRSILRTERSVERAMFAGKTIDELRAARDKGEAIRPEMVALLGRLIEQVKAEGSRYEYKQSKEVQHLRLTELMRMRDGLDQNPVTLPEKLDETERALAETIRVMVTSVRTARVRSALSVDGSMQAILLLGMDSLARLHRAWAEEQLRQWSANRLPRFYKAIGADPPPVDAEARKLAAPYAAVVPKEPAPTPEGGNAGQ
jgi:hypothetical protein